MRDEEGGGLLDEDVEVEMENGMMLFERADSD